MRLLHELITAAPPTSAAVLRTKEVLRITVAHRQGTSTVRQGFIVQERTGLNGYVSTLEEHESTSRAARHVTADKRALQSQPAHGAFYKCTPARSQGHIAVDGGVLDGEPLDEANQSSPHTRAVVPDVARGEHDICAEATEVKASATVRRAPAHRHLAHEHRHVALSQEDGPAVLPRRVVHKVHMTQLQIIALQCRVNCSSCAHGISNNNTSSKYNTSATLVHTAPCVHQTVSATSRCTDTETTHPPALPALSLWNIASRTVVRKLSNTKDRAPPSLSAMLPVNVIRSSSMSQLLLPTYMPPPVQVG